MLLRLPNFAYKRGRKPLGRLPLKRVVTLEEKLSLANLLLPVMTGEKATEKGKKPIASSNTPTPMTSDSYAMDAGFTLVTRSREKLSKKQVEVITPTRPSASSTRPSAATPSRPTVSSTSKGSSIPSTYSDVVVPVRFSPVPEIRTYFQKSVSIPEVLVEPEYDDPKIREVVKKAYPSGFFYIPEDLHKTRQFYEFILVDTKSVEITHIPSNDDPLKTAYSKLKNFKLMNSTYWNQDPYTEKTFSKPFVPHSYSYIDYQMAWFNVIWYQNYEPSWFIQFCENT